MLRKTNENPTPEPPRSTALLFASAGRPVPKRTCVVGAVAATLAVNAAGLSLAMAPPRA